MKLELDLAAVTYRQPPAPKARRRGGDGDRPLHPEQPAALMSALRKAAGMKQSDVALVFGTSRTSVTNMESRRQAVSFEYIDKLASHIGVELVMSIRPKTDPSNAK